MERGFVSAIATNGAGIIHDFELALSGATSEDVDEALGPGKFGMAEETGPPVECRDQRWSRPRARDWSGDRSISGSAKPPHASLSVVAAAARLDIPVTVHVGIGTDIIHMHPDASGAAIGEGSLRDFRYFASNVARLAGGVYLNCGSAVILPEVFLKAVALARNRGVRARWPDDGQPGFRAAVSSAHERGVSAGRGDRQGLLTGGASRDHDSASRGGPCGADVRAASHRRCRGAVPPAFPTPLGVLRRAVRRAIVIEPTRLIPAYRWFQHTICRKIRRGPS